MNSLEQNFNLAQGVFVDVDGDGEPTLWRNTGNPDRPSPVLRRCDLPSEHRDLWTLLTSGMVRRCSLCDEALVYQGLGAWICTEDHVLPAPEDTTGDRP